MYTNTNGICYAMYMHTHKLIVEFITVLAKSEDDDDDYDEEEETMDTSTAPDGGTVIGDNQSQAPPPYQVDKTTPTAPIQIVIEEAPPSTFASSAVPNTALLSTGYSVSSNTLSPNSVLSTSTAPDSAPLTEESDSKEQEMFPLLPEGMTREELIEKVTKFFPTFKPNGILRFSSLITPNPASVPQPWKDCKKPTKRKRKRAEDAEKGEVGEFRLKYGPIPDPEMWDDQEKRFLCPVGKGDEGQGGEGGGGEGRTVDSETKEWRFGPAKVWYDMINLPEDGHGLDYGFKLKVQCIE